MDGLFKSLDGIPSYTGKARFMDKVIKAKRWHADVLAFDLKLDASER